MTTRFPLNVPPEIAQRFVDDMRAYFAEPNRIKREEIVVRQLSALRQHLRPSDPDLDLIHIEELFDLMRDQFP
jgi:hypothetical protein